MAKNDYTSRKNPKMLAKSWIKIQFFADSIDKWLTYFLLHFWYYLANASHLAHCHSSRRVIGWIFFQSLFTTLLLLSLLWNSITSKRIELQTSGCSRFLENSQALQMVLEFLCLSFKKTEKIPFKNRAIFMRRVVNDYIRQNDRRVTDIFLL